MQRVNRSVTKTTFHIRQKRRTTRRTRKALIFISFRIGEIKRERTATKCVVPALISRWLGWSNPALQSSSRAFFHALLHVPASNRMMIDLEQMQHFRTAILLCLLQVSKWKETTRQRKKHRRKKPNEMERDFISRPNVNATSRKP